MSPLFYYRLARLALLWLCIMLPLSWPGRSAPPPTPPAPPSKPKRSPEPTAFEGLPHKPACALCAQETGETKPPPAVRPEPMPPTHRRPRTVATSMHGCPHDGGRYRGGLALHNRRAKGHPTGAPWRQWPCLRCRGDCPEHHGPIVHGTQAAVELSVRGLACLAEGLGSRATARVCEGAPNPVRQWWGAAAEQRRALCTSLLCDLPLEPGPLEEVYAVLRARKAGESSDAEAMKRLEPSPSCGWTARDPQSTWLVGVAVGSRTLAMAQRGVPQVPRVWAPHCLPLLVTEGCTASRTAILAHCGCWMPPEWRQDTGPRPKPRWLPLPALLYAQGVKAYRRRRMVGGTHRVVCGTRWAIEPVLAAWGWKLNPACVERLNRARRPRVAASGRRGHTLCQGEEGCLAQRGLVQPSHHCVLPHASLRQPWPMAAAPHGRGSAQRWQPCPPALAAGVTDHVWALTEGLLSRVPPWPQPAGVCACGGGKQPGEGA